MDTAGSTSASFTFNYSPRRGTEAADMPDQLEHGVKQERMSRLVDLVQKHSLERAQRFVGRDVEVLVEGRSRKDPSKVRGRTRHNKVVNFDGLAEAGEFTTVHVDRATSLTLAGSEKLLARALA